MSTNRSHYFHCQNIFDHKLNGAQLASRLSLLKYFKAKSGFPDPNGSLSRVITSKAIALANKEVEKTKKARAQSCMQK